ncbi:MAG: mechanosensitive ion channel family protein [Dysgonamonadaceae bacterium]|jgi:small-conductance mechanosensitive channel|nr:mechanosensitive ion channel family protein [Dysgonamonadaceae bacterium]
MQRIVVFIFLLLLGRLIASGQVTDTSALSVAAAVDTVVTDNVTASALLIRSQNESMAASLREALLLGQMKNNENQSQREALELELRQFRVSDSLRHAVMQRQIDSLKRNATGAPVVLNYDTIVRIYAKLGSFSPAERAATNSERILKAAKQFVFEQDSLTIMDSGSTIDVMYNDITLLCVSELDALWMNTDSHALAEQCRQLLEAAFVKYKHDMSVANIMKMIGLSLLVILMQVVLILLVNYLFIRLLDKHLTLNKDQWFKGIRFRNLEIITPVKELQALLFISKIVRYIIYFIMLYLTLPLLFSIFPFTQELANKLFGWILTPLVGIWKGFVNYLPKLLKIIVIVVVIKYIIRFFRYLMREIESGRLTISGFYPDWAKATYNIIRILLYAFTIVVIFPLLPNSDSDIFKGVSVFIGLVVSLGSTAIVGNLVAGLVITYMRPFKVGDRIKVGDVFGDVIEKSPFVIRVMTIKKEIITVPNLTILSSNVINYSTSALEEGVILYTTVTMGYEVPQQKVYSLLISAALKTANILAEPTPFVLSTGMGDNAASYQINAYTRHPEHQADIYSELNRNIIDLFHEAGIEMIIPHYQAVRNGNASAIPKNEK